MKGSLVGADDKETGQPMKAQVSEQSSPFDRKVERCNGRLMIHGHWGGFGGLNSGRVGASIEPDGVAAMVTRRDTGVEFLRGCGTMGLRSLVVSWNES